MHPFGSYCIGSLGGGGGFRGGGGDVVCKRLALASAGVVSLGVASTVVEPIGGAVDDEGGGAGSRGDVATDNPHNSANAAANTTKVPRRNRADVIRNLPHSLQGAAGEGRVASQVLTPKSCPSKKQQCQKICETKSRRNGHILDANTPRSYVICASTPPSARSGLCILPVTTRAVESRCTATGRPPRAPSAAARGRRSSSNARRITCGLPRNSHA